MEPLEPGKGIEFESKIVGGAVPKEYIKPIEQGMREALLKAESLQDTQLQTLR